MLIGACEGKIRVFAILGKRRSFLQNNSQKNTEKRDLIWLTCILYLVSFDRIIPFEIYISTIEGKE